MSIGKKHTHIFLEVSNIHGKKDLYMRNDDMVIWEQLTQPHKPAMVRVAFSHTKCTRECNSDHRTLCHGNKPY